MAAPSEFIYGPYQIYYADEGTAEPSVDADPPSDWTLLGTSGGEDYAEAGVRIDRPQALSEVRTAGSTGLRDIRRTSDDLNIMVDVYDLNIDLYAKLYIALPQGFCYRTEAIASRRMLPKSGSLPHNWCYQE